MLVADRSLHPAVEQGECAGVGEQAAEVEPCERVAGVEVAEGADRCMALIKPLIRGIVVG